MSPESHCLSCGIATICSTPRNKELHSAVSKPGEYAFLDIQQPIVTVGLTPATSYDYYLFVVDAYPCFLASLAWTIKWLEEVFCRRCLYCKF